VHGNRVPQDRLIPDILGSIQLFPGKSAATLADVWRVAPVPGSGPVKVRAARVEDYAAVRALERQPHSGAPAPTLRQFEARRQVFAEGQWVAECGGVIVGAASSMIVAWDGYPAQESWKAITADGTFATHDPHSHTLFGSDLVADASRRGFGVGRALNLARRRLCRRWNLRRIAYALPLPGHAEMAEEMPPDLYAKRVVWGEIDEPLLRFHIAQGFQYCGILPDFLPGEGGPAALVAWLNPLYAPPGPSAFAASQRARKCA
jgi:GNAT superfamily N-acetyltransferase